MLFMRWSDAFYALDEAQRCKQKERLSLDASFKGRQKTMVSKQTVAIRVDAVWLKQQAWLTGKLKRINSPVTSYEGWLDGVQLEAKRKGPLG